MSVKDRTKEKMSEQEIDRIVETQANEDSAWEKPIHVRRTEPAFLSIPADLAVRAAFLAQLHRTESVEEWLAHVIQERVELEEAAFIEVKQALAAGSG